jgi:mannose-6-phosphate isomerase-like protein (cupin superfamily)
MSVIPARGGEVVGDSPERRVEILCDDDPLHATWSRFGPGREGADLHVHRRHTDLFYVLEGELTVRLGLEDRRVAVPAGTLARVPPLVVHGFRNASDTDMRYLNFHAPGQGFADYMRALRDGRTLTYDQEPPPAEGGRPPSEAVIGGEERLGDGTVLLADTDAIRIAVVAGRAPQPTAYVYVLEGEQMGSWAPPGADLRAPARFLEIRAPGRT